MTKTQTQTQTQTRDVLASIDEALTEHRNLSLATHVASVLDSAAPGYVCPITYDVTTTTPSLNPLCSCHDVNDPEHIPRDPLRWLTPEDVAAIKQIKSPISNLNGMWMYTYHVLEQTNANSYEAGAWCPPDTAWEDWDSYESRSPSPYSLPLPTPNSAPAAGALSSQASEISHYSISITPLPELVQDVLDGVLSLTEAQRYLSTSLTTSATNTDDRDIG